MSSPTRSGLGGSNRQQTPGAPKIALEPIAPDTEMVSLRGIPPSDQGNAATQFGQGDRTEKKLTAIPALEPSHQAGIGTRTSAELGDDVRVQQVAVHERSISRGNSRAWLKSASSPASGMARSKALRSGKTVAPADWLSSRLARKSNSARCSTGGSISTADSISASVLTTGDYLPNRTQARAHLAHSPDAQRTVLIIGIWLARNDVQSSARSPAGHIFTSFGSKRPSTSTRSVCAAMTVWMSL